MNSKKSLCKVFAPFLLLFLLVLIIPQRAYADIQEVSNKSGHSSGSYYKYKMDLTAEMSSVTFKNIDSSTMAMTLHMATDSEFETEFIEEAWKGSYTIEALPAGTYYFYNEGGGTVNISWTEIVDNTSIENAKAISVKEGRSKTISIPNNSPSYNYYTLKVTDSNYYEFDVTSGHGGVYLMKGKTDKIDKSMFDTTTGALQEAEKLLLLPATYTIACISVNGADLKISNIAYTGLTEIGGKSSVSVSAMGDPVTYTLKLTPADNDVSVSYKIDDNLVKVVQKSKTKYTFQSEKMFTGTCKVTFTTDDGFSKTVKVKVGPSAPEGKSEGDTKSTTLTISGTNVAKYVIYQKSGSKYKKVKTVKASSNGYSTVKATVKKLKAGKKYTFKIVAYDKDGNKGGEIIHKAITAYNKKVSAKAVCQKTTYSKQGYEWVWEKTGYNKWTLKKKKTGNVSTAYIKVTYKDVKEGFALIDGGKWENGSVIYKYFSGKIGGGKTAKVKLQAVRESANSIAYGPESTIKVKVKAAR